MGAPTVPFQQVANPVPRISASPQGLTAVVRYRVAWSDAFTFVNDIMGILDGQPWTWPSSPNMRAYNAEIEPIGVREDVALQVPDVSFGSSPGEFYEFAMVTVTFGSQASLATMPYTSDTVPVVIPPADTFDPEDPIEMSSYQVTYGTQMIKPPGGALDWAGFKANGDPQIIPAGVGKPESGSIFWLIPTFDLNLTLHNCISVNYAIVRNKIGLVNDSVLFTNCDPETLLFNGLSTHRREMSDGVAILDVTLNYKWKSIGWNMAFGSNGQLYRYTSEGGSLLYQRTDIHPQTLFPAPTRWKPGGLNGMPGR